MKRFDACRFTDVLADKCATTRPLASAVSLEIQYPGEEIQDGVLV